MKSRQTDPRGSVALALLMVLLIPPAAIAEERGSKWVFFDRLGQRIETTALVGVKSAVGTGSGRSQKLELLFEPEFEMEMVHGMDLTAIGRARGDVFDELEPGDPSQDEVSNLSRRLIMRDRLDLELRELFVEADWGRTFLTIGKQQIVWGKADGLKVLDVLNPQDFREFILDDFDDSRIPLWSVNAEIPLKDIVVQLVWIPDPTYHALPEPDSVYAFTSPLLVPSPPPGVGVVVQEVDKPKRFFADSDAGIRLSTFWKGWDLTLNYLYHYYDLPVLFQERSLSPEGPRVTVTPRYERSHLVGGTFSNAFGDMTVRGEVGFSFDRFFLADDLDDIDGVVETDELAYVLGLDWYGIEETLISLQLFQSWIVDDNPSLVRDKVNTTLTLLLQREFINDRLVPSILWLHNVNQNDGLARPKVTFELRDEIKIWTGFDVFYGKQDGLFGQFDEKDRVVFGIEWGI